jgi:hypothetical protein
MIDLIGSIGDANGQEPTFVTSTSCGNGRLDGVSAGGLTRRSE